jgi:transcriptional regulator GlxA family with amidase domain
MIAPAQPIDVLFVILPHSLLLDIAGPAEAFRLANQHRERRGLPLRFRLQFAGPLTTPPTSVGLALADLAPLPERLVTPTWVVVVGQPTEHLGQVTPAMTTTAKWLSQRLGESLRTADPSHRLLTICSGTLLAARAGLLGTRRCTTHHELLGTLRTLAPQAQVIDNRVFVIDGPLASSAGITAGIDIALHLIAEECGEALAASVAEDMVVYLRRSPSDPELSPFQMHRRHLHGTVHRVQDAIISRPQRDWDVNSLAAVGHTTGRHLLRLFMEHAGISALDYLRLIRLERARQSIEYGASVTRAAEVAGFRSSLQLRRAWSRQWGGSPRDVAAQVHFPQPVPASVRRRSVARA